MLGLPQRAASAAGRVLAPTAAASRPLLAPCSAYRASGDGGGADGGGGGGPRRRTAASSSSASSYQRRRPSTSTSWQEDGGDYQQPRRRTQQQRRTQQDDDGDNGENERQRQNVDANAAAQAVVAVVKSSKKLRRGPFAGLITEMHAEMVSPSPPPKKEEKQKAAPKAAAATEAGAPPAAAAAKTAAPTPAAAKTAQARGRTTTPAATTAEGQQQQKQQRQPSASARSTTTKAGGANARATASPSVGSGEESSGCWPPPGAAQQPLDSSPLLLVVVEGDADAAAVHRAAPASPCYVCDGTRAMRPHAKQELDVLAAIAGAGAAAAAAAAAASGEPSTATAAAAAAAAAALPRQPRKVELVVLTDPDERGRELRAFLDEALAPARPRHAFVPEAAATSTRDSAKPGGHAAGNRGIEHCAPCDVRAALDAARPSYGPGRRAFTPEWARERGLAGAFEGAPHDGGEAARRRRALCARLGLGQCSSAQLLSALNRYFGEGDVEEAIKALMD